jgi:hypothetical protein
MIRSFRHVLGAALVIPFLAASAHAQPDDRAAAREGDGTKAATDGFLGRRPLLKDLSAADQKLLASLILEYTTADKNAVVKVHENTMMDPKLHAVHQAPYVLLFSWHRTYIEGLESFLTSKGQGRFVPLPKWIPSDPIPTVFGENTKGKKIIKDFTPTVDWSMFIHSKLSVFKEEIRAGDKDTTPNNLILADTLVVPHNNTHNMIGGTMSTMGSPAVPIFWCYHAFIDDIAWDYEHLPASKNMKLEEGAAPEKGVTTIRGTVMVDKDGNVMVMTKAGDFNIANEPFKSILKDMDGKEVALQATLDNDQATVESVTAHASTGLNVRDTHGKLLGSRASMEEVRISGQLGGKFEVDTPDGKKGFVVKTGVSLVDGASKTPGMMGAMHGHSGE